MVDATNVFGPLVMRHEVEQAVVDSLTKWMPTYLAEIERRTDTDAQTFKSSINWEIASAFPADGSTLKPPSGIVVSPGTSRDPERKGDGTLSVWWEIRVAIVVGANSRFATNRLASIYAAAALWIMDQQLCKDAAPLVSAVKPLGEVNTATRPDYLNAGWASEQGFEVLTEGVVTRYGGPAEPDLDPSPIPVVQTTEVLTDARRPT